jgi:hypothetical protein
MEIKLILIEIVEVFDNSSCIENGARSDFSDATSMEIKLANGHDAAKSCDHSRLLDDEDDDDDDDEEQWHLTISNVSGNSSTVIQQKFETLNCTANYPLCLHVALPCMDRSNLI